MGRMLNPAARTLKNSQGQCSENTVLPVLKIQVRIFLSLKRLKSWSLENLEQVGGVGSLISMGRQLAATKAWSNINAAVLSRCVWTSPFSSSEMSWMRLTSAFQRSRTPTTKPLWEHSHSRLARQQLAIAKLPFSPTQRSFSQKNRTPLHPSDPTVSLWTAFPRTNYWPCDHHGALLCMKKRMGHMPTLQGDAMQSVNLGYRKQWDTNITSPTTCNPLQKAQDSCSQHGFVM